MQKDNTGALDALNAAAREVSDARAEVDRRFGRMLSTLRGLIKAERARLGMTGKC